MRFSAWMLLISVLLFVGCSRTPPTKYRLQGFHADMPLDELKQEREWVPAELKGWDLQSAGELNGVAGTFYANEHNNVVTRVRFFAEADQELSQDQLKTTADEYLAEIEKQYGESTFPSVHNDNPSVDRTEWLDQDYDLVVTLRETDLQVEIRNKLARSIEVRDDNADKVN